MKWTRDSSEDEQQALSRIYKNIYICQLLTEKMIHYSSGIQIENMNLHVYLYKTSLIKSIVNIEPITT